MCLLWLQILLPLRRPPRLILAALRRLHHPMLLFRPQRPVRLAGGKQIGHGSDEMVKRYTHLDDEYVTSELARVNSIQIAPFDPIAQAVL